MWTNSKGKRRRLTPNFKQPWPYLYGEEHLASAITSVLAARNPLMPREERQEQRPRNGGQKGEEGVRVGGVPGDGLRT